MNSHLTDPGVFVMLRTAPRLHLLRSALFSILLPLLCAQELCAQTLATEGVLYGTASRAGGGQLLTINPATGAGTAVGPTGLPFDFVASLAVDKLGRIYTCSIDNDIHLLDAATGATTLVGGTGIGDPLEALAFDLNGDLYGVTVASSNLYKVNQNTGAATLIGACGAELAGLSVDPTTGTLYGSGAGGGATPDGIFTVNKANGLATFIGNTGLGGATPDIAFDQAGTLYGAKGGGGSPNNLILINKVNGASVLIGPIGHLSVSGLSFAPPQPALAKADDFYGSLGQGGGGLIISIDDTTGVGTLRGASGLVGVPGLAIDSRGRIYGTEQVTGDLYRIDAVTGAATLIGPTGVDCLDGLVFDFNDVLYAVGTCGLDDLFTINPTTAVATLIGATGEQMAGLAFDHTAGHLYGSAGGAGAVNPDGIYTINTGNGVATLVGTTGLGGSLGDATPDLACDWDGNLYGTKGGGLIGSTWISINKANGVGTVVGPIGFVGVSGVGSLPVRRSPPNTCLASQGGSGDGFWVLDEETAVGTFLGQMGVVGMPGLAIDHEGRVFGTSRSGSPGNPSKLYRINAFNGKAVLVGDTGVDAFDAIAFDADGTLYGFGNWGNDDLYKIDVTTGAATFVSSLPSLLVQGAAFDPTDGRLWVSALDANTLAPDMIYAISKHNGFIYFTGQTGLGQFMQDLHFDALGRLQGISGGGGNPTSLYNVSKTTGAATLVGATGAIGLSGMASWPRLRTAETAVFYGSRGAGGTGDELLEIDPVTGVGGLIGHSGLAGMPALAIDSKGRIYASDSNEKLYVVDALDASAIVVGPTGHPDVLEALAFDANDVLWGVDVANSELYRLDPLTGAATFVGATGVNVAGLAVDPTSGLLWASGAGCCGGADNIYTLNKTTGLATFVGTTGLGGATPDLCFDALGNLFGTKSGSNLIRINKANGAGVVVGPIGFTSVSGLASVPLLLHNAAPQVIYASEGGVGNDIYRIDPNTGDGTLVGTTGIPTGMPGLAIDSQGRIYTTARQSGDLYRVDALTGKAVFVAPTGITFLDAIAFDQSDVLWGAGDAGPSTLYTINVNTGASVAIGAMGEEMAGIAFDPTTGVLWGSAGGAAPTNPDGIYTVNLGNGVATLVGTTGLGGATPDLAFDALGNLYAVKGGSGPPSTFLSIDKGSGAGTAIGSVGFAGVSGMGSYVFTDVVSAPTPDGGVALELLPSVPNPFSDETTIRFVLPAAGEARLDVYSVSGRHVATLADGRLEAGPHSIPFDGRDFRSGVYFYRLQFAGQRRVEKMVLIR